MRLRNLLLGLLVSTYGLLTAQTHITQVGHLDYLALHNVQLNDCWGYTDETGIEYALVGTTGGTSVVSLENPSNPVEIAWIPGTSSIWRDIQVYQDYAYVTTEAEDGLLIIDLSPLPTSTDFNVNYYFGPSGNPWESAHDVFVDTTGGWAYICGANRGNGGMIILDIHTDPMHPIETGVFDNWYCHDAFAQGNLLYGAHISTGFFSVIDVSDHSQPVLINTQNTPNNFSHNIWVTSDDHFAVTTDEVAGAFLTMYEVTSPSNIQEKDRIRSSPGANVVPHNAFILYDSIIVSSYYTDGITVHDMSRPGNLVQTGNFDTHPNQNQTMSGCWGVYPYLPSGLILASDMTQGLFVLQPEYVNAAYYEGLVRQAGDLTPLSNVKVSIESDPQSDQTGLDGTFGVGTINYGPKQVTFYKLMYFPQTVSIDFSPGNVVFDTIDLVPMPTYSLTVVVEDETGNPIVDAQVRVTDSDMSQDGTTNGFGESNFSMYYTGNMQITAGKWEYVTHCGDYTIDETTGTLTIQLESGYYDDFSFDFGWTATDNGVYSGKWERGTPHPDPDHASPSTDGTFDCGNWACFTGNDEVTTSDQDDLDGGRVWLYSPVFDLSGFADPYLYCEYWFFCHHGPEPPDDTLEIWLSNGLEQVMLMQVPPPGYLDVIWQPLSVRVIDFFQPTGNMQLMVTLADENPRINITEGALDVFVVTDNSILGEKELLSDAWDIYPNPGSDKINVNAPEDCNYTLVSLSGVPVLEGRFQKGQNALGLSALPQGMYLLQCQGNTFRIVHGL